MVYKKRKAVMTIVMPKIPPIEKVKYSQTTFSERGFMAIRTKPITTIATIAGLLVHFRKVSKCRFTNVPI